jgi:hypothetical protein
MKIKLLVIFFFISFFSYLIYNNADNERKYITIIGDDFLFSYTKNTYDNYLYKHLKDNHKLKEVNKLFTSEYLTYKEIINNIKDNYYLVEKNKNTYLNTTLSSADYIIINMQNLSFFEKCNKNESVVKNYIDNQFLSFNDMINLINKLSKAEIIFIGNYCYEYKQWLDEYMVNKFKDYKYINIYKGIHNYPQYMNYGTAHTLTDEGHYFIFNEIIKVLN